MKIDRALIVRWKIHIDRSRMYIGYVQFLVTILILLKLYRKTAFGALIFEHPWISFPVIFIVFLAFCILLGYIDSILRLREAENLKLAKQNPVAMKTQDDLEKIKKDLEEIKQIVKDKNSLKN